MLGKGILVKERLAFKIIPRSRVRKMRLSGAHGSVVKSRSDSVF
jgi:hypothetical protein